MIQFTIVKRVWLHNRTFSPGQEALLRKMGFNNDALQEQIQKGRVVLDNLADEARLFDVATDAAIKYAIDHDLDIFSVPFGTGTKGRITVSDIRKYFNGT